MNSECGQEISLKDAVQFIVDNRGRTAPTVDIGIVLIATNCVSNQDLYPKKLNVRFVSQATYNNWFRSHPLSGDILLTNKGSQNGAVCLVPDPVDFCIAQDMVALRADPKKIEPLYLFAALRSDLVQQRIKALNVDAVIPHLKKTDFDKLFIPLPLRKVQLWIGECYFDLSRKIELLRETNITLESIAKALFKSWFVDFDPVHAKVEGVKPEGMDAATAEYFPDSLDETECGLVPRGWNMGILADLANLNPEAWTTKNRPATVSYIDLANAKENVIAEIMEYSFEEAPSRARRVLRDGDTIIGTVRPGNRSFAFIANADKNLTGSTGFAVLRPIHKESAEFIYLAATSDTNIEYLTHIADGGAYPAVRPEVIISLQSILPGYDVLRAFHNIAGPIFKKIACNHQQAKTFIQLRDTLLTRLMSDGFCLSESEISIENTLLEVI
ncbi:MULTISPECIES: restriction endonuclease subunit S [unclassified Pseudomonas]|uniref:restriction endonuclease subunit S n=1 Tax=unclassified Pseudomonas TaxID=196821 RepID=UPI000537DA0D|nr:MULTISPECIES: restriction endonuclease subunit S [unclassified Pseudomonas]MBD0685011.1 restriction endonuclease subunit S [Pseudomonas sp. PSB18]CDF94935.1 Type I restriction-modification system,specificity subunit S [Pseudomonas sp. SHC52]